MMPIGEAEKQCSFRHFENKCELDNWIPNCRIPAASRAQLGVGPSRPVIAVLSVIQAAVLKDNPYSPVYSILAPVPRFNQPRVHAVSRQRACNMKNDWSISKTPMAVVYVSTSKRPTRGYTRVRVPVQDGFDTTL